MNTCTEFSLIISLKKTNIMGQDVSSTAQISISDHTLEVVDFTYLGSNIPSNLSLDAELNVHIGKAATAMTRRANRVWGNTMLMTNTKMKVYKACVLSTLLCRREAWSLYSRQEDRLKAFTCVASDESWASPGKISLPTRVSWLRKGYQACFAMLTQRRLHWLGHIRGIDNGCILKDVLHGELDSGSRPMKWSAL